MKSVGVMRVMATVKLCVLLSISYLLININMCGVTGVAAASVTPPTTTSLITSHDLSKRTAHKTRHKHGQQLRMKDNSLWDLFNDYQRSIVPANERFAQQNNSKKVPWKKSPPTTRKKEAMQPSANHRNQQLYFNKTPTRTHHHNHNVLVKEPPRSHYKTTTITSTTSAKYNEEEEEEDDDYLDDATASARSYRGTDSQNPNGFNADGSEVGDGSLTRAKHAEFGNHDAVERNFRKEVELKSRAHENLIRTRTFGECRWPKMEVVYIDSSDRSKRYEPHATMLHRCNNRTACCHNDSLTCVAKRMERVTVVFSVFNMAGQLDHHKTETFDNHTECHCIQKVIISTYRSPFRTVKPTKKPCVCPSLFQKVSRNEDDHCVCDCWENNEDCIQLRQGNGYLTLMDRQCINNQHCAEPSCEFGRFLTTDGRCTRREEKVNAGRHAG